jgi:hypothetical protein
MPCQLPSEEPLKQGLKQPADCKCYGAVMRTYKSMSDEPDYIALEAAKRVYRFHHPEDSKLDSAITVERWINETRVQ